MVPMVREQSDLSSRSQGNVILGNVIGNFDNALTHGPRL